MLFPPIFMCVSITGLGQRSIGLHQCNFAVGQRHKLQPWSWKAETEAKAEPKAIKIHSFYFFVGHFTLAEVWAGLGVGPVGHGLTKTHIKNWLLSWFTIKLAFFKCRGRHAGCQPFLSLVDVCSCWCCGWAKYYTNPHPTLSHTPHTHQWVAQNISS